MTTLRIFISSPGDVAEEREKARQVIEQLQRQNGSSLELIPVLWKTFRSRPTALSRRASI